MARVWNRKPPTREELIERRKEIVEARTLLELEIDIEEELVAFRELKLQWLDDRVTLDDILNDDTWSICKKISKLRGSRDAARHSPR